MSYDLSSNALHNEWFEVAPSPNRGREWRVYSSAYSSKVIAVPGPNVTIEGGMATFSNVSVLTAPAAGTFIADLQQLIDQMSQGKPPVASDAIFAAADRAVNASKSTDDDVRGWAKRLAESAFKH